MNFPVPYVLECMHFKAASSLENSRIVRDYEFDLYIDGERDIILDGIPFHIGKNCLVFRKPGQFTVGKGDYDMYLLTVDFCGEGTNSQEYFRGSDTPEQKKCDFDLIEGIPPVFYPEHAAELADLYKKIAGCSYPSVVDTERQKMYITEFLLLVLYDAQGEIRKEKERQGKNSYIKKICDYVNKNCCNNLSVEDIAEKFSLNVNYLIRIFKKETGLTPGSYILEARLRRARYMLSQTDLPVQEIAYGCGFNTPSYFSKCFKKRFGKNPKKYR